MLVDDDIVLCSVVVISIVAVVVAIIILLFLKFDLIHWSLFCHLSMATAHQNYVSKLIVLM